MIRITVEMYPGGLEEGKYLLGTADIWNVGKHDRHPYWGNYRYSINLKRKQGWRTGIVQNFNRSRLNVWFLIQAVLDEIVNHSSV